MRGASLAVFTRRTTGRLSKARLYLDRGIVPHAVEDFCGACRAASGWRPVEDTSDARAFYRREYFAPWQAVDHVR